MYKLFLFIFMWFASPEAFSETDEVIMVERGSKKMELAFEQARSNVDRFLNVVLNKPEGTEDYRAYIKFEEGETTEYLWLADVQKYDDEYYIGVVVSRPALVANVEYGKTIGFRVLDIYDWMYFNIVNDSNVGSFTACALHKLGNPDDEKYLKEAKINCTP